MFDYVWKTKFNNGEILNQFEGDKENSFREVVKRNSEIDLFYLIATGNEKYVHIVDFNNGNFSFHGNVVTNEIDSKVFKGSNPRIIFFRENQIFLNNTEVVGNQVIGFTLGWQITLGDDNLQKQFLILSPPQNEVKVIKNDLKDYYEGKYR